MADTRDGSTAPGRSLVEPRRIESSRHEYWCRRLVDCILSGADLRYLFRICLVLGHLEPSAAEATLKRNIVKGVIGDGPDSKYVYIDSVFELEVLRKVYRAFGILVGNLSYATICTAIGSLDFSALVEKRYLPLDRKSPVIPFLLVILYVKMASPSDLSVSIYYAVMSAKSRKMRFEWHAGGSRVTPESFLTAFMSRRLRFEETGSRTNLYFNEMFESCRLRYSDMKKAVMDALCDEAMEEEELRSKVESMKQSKMIEESFASIRKYLGVSERMVLINLKFLAHPNRVMREDMFGEENVRVLVELVRKYLEGELESKEVVEGCLRLLIGWMRLKEESLYGKIGYYAGTKIEKIKVIDSRKPKEERLKDTIRKMNGLIVSLCQKGMDERLFALYCIHWGCSLAVLDREEMKVPLALFKYYLVHAIKMKAPHDYFSSFLNGFQGILIYAPAYWMLKMVDALLKAWDCSYSDGTCRLPKLPVPFDADKMLLEEEGISPSRRGEKALAATSLDKEMDSKVPSLYHRINLFSMFRNSCLERLYLYGLADQGLMDLSSYVQQRLLSDQSTSKLIALIACSGILSGFAFSSSLPFYRLLSDSKPEITFHLFYQLQYSVSLSMESYFSSHVSSYPTFRRAWRQSLAIFLSDPISSPCFLDGATLLRILLSVMIEDVFEPFALFESLEPRVKVPTSTFDEKSSYDPSLLSMSHMLVRTISRLLSVDRSDLLISQMISALLLHAETIALEWEKLHQRLHLATTLSRENALQTRPSAALPTRRDKSAEDAPPTNEDDRYEERASNGYNNGHSHADSGFTHSDGLAPEIDGGDSAGSASSNSDHTGQTESSGIILEAPGTSSAWQVLSLFLDRYFTANVLLVRSICPRMLREQTANSLKIIYLLNFCPSENHELHESLLKTLLFQLFIQCDKNLFDYLIDTYLKPIKITNSWEIFKLEAFMHILLISIQEFSQSIQHETMQNIILPLLFSSLDRPGSSKLNALTHSIFSILFKSPSQNHLVPYYLKLSLQSFPQITSHSSLYLTLQALFSSSHPRSPIVPYVTKTIVDKIKESQLSPGTAVLAGLFFLLINTSHLSVLPIILEQVETLLSNSPAPLQALYCKLLYKIISSNCDYSRKQALTHWYLHLFRNLNIYSKL